MGIGLTSQDLCFGEDVAILIGFIRQIDRALLIVVGKIGIIAIHNL